ncbi:MAG: fibronectin type III domain-containing protein, partial [Treponema sp.]|nr:fibronectin type III domain-containing protein [Treponema sp.]
IRAVARDGAVDLSWKDSSDADLGGYLVYYGTSSTAYFGKSAILGVSPIDVGISTSVHIDGLKNGTLYYFAVAAYDKADQPHIGEFSKEAAARPLQFIYPASY